MAAKKKGSSSSSKIISLNAMLGKLYNAEKERGGNVIGSRIQAAREAQGLTLAGFADLLGDYGITLQRSAVGKWETGMTIPNAYQLVGICHALQIEDGINYFTCDPRREDILNPEGWDKLADYKDLLIASGKYKPVAPAITFEERIRHITMRISTLSVSAGTGAFLSDDSFEEQEFPASAVPANADFGIRVSGNSMEPVYHDGQIVWVQRCEALNPGDVGIFEYDGNGYLKVYATQEPDENNKEYFISSDGTLNKQTVLISYNEAYRPIVISPHAYFRVAGKVLN